MYCTVLQIVGCVTVICSNRRPILCIVTVYSFFEVVHLTSNDRCITANLSRVIDLLVQFMFIA
jgi:hypothetical protein